MGMAETISLLALFLYRLPHNELGWGEKKVRFFALYFSGITVYLQRL